jgi:hypothetical protein
MSSFLLRYGATPGPFDTSFPLTENPISQGGIWFNGATDGGSWSDMQTTSGHCVGSRTMDVAGNSFADDIAFLKTSYRSFSPNQWCQGTVYLAPGYTCANAYVAIVRWNGPLANFTAIQDPGVGSIAVPNDGDVLYAEINGQIVTIKLNGSTVMTHTVMNDGAGNNFTELTTGQPGLGAWPSGTSHEMELRLRDSYSGGNWTGYEVIWGMSGVTTTVTPSSFGWKNYKAGNL